MLILRGRHESAPADRIAGPALHDEIILTDVEKAKHLMTYDLGLAENQCRLAFP
jgi:hypothetical protein